MKTRFLILLFCFPFFLLEASTHTIYRDIPYVQVNSSSFNPERHTLDVYAPKVKNVATEVVVFIHGGKWKMANKEMFNYVGVNFAEKGITTVLINYRLTPEVQYEEMAMDCAKAVEWVYSQIGYYGGDKTKIYICGHSSGGHLAALIGTNNRFFDTLGMANPIKGCMLIDGFGMDIDNYLRHPNPDHEWMYDTFGKDEARWKDASPALFVTEKSPRYIIFLGEKTKNIIYHDVRNFKEVLEKKGIGADLIVMDNRKHMEMIGQLLDYRNEIYDKCIAFMRFEGKK